MRFAQVFIRLHIADLRVCKLPCAHETMLGALVARGSMRGEQNHHLDIRPGRREPHVLLERITLPRNAFDPFALKKRGTPMKEFPRIMLSVYYFAKRWEPTVSTTVRLDQNLPLVTFGL